MSPGPASVAPKLIERGNVEVRVDPLARTLDDAPWPVHHG